nr:heparinase II/III family protein [Planctomycetota bacterium]
MATAVSILHRLCLALLLLAAAVRVSALDVPASYNRGHPRLPHPDAAYLQRLAASPMYAKYRAAAEAWDSSDPTHVLGQFRRFLIAYLASKAAGAPNASWLAKAEALADLGPTWGKLLYARNDGVGDGTYTLRSPTANFLTGLPGGGSAAGQLLSINGRMAWITAVIDAHTITVGASMAPPTGSGLKIRIVGGYQAFMLMKIAMLYDWLYADLSAHARAEFRSQLDSLATIWEEDWAGLGACPYNDVMYVRMSCDGLIGALALYPDADDADPVARRGSYHLSYMKDKFIDVLLPVWHQVFGEHGGGWHEDWNGYVNSPSGTSMTQWLVAPLLSWQEATGDPLFARESWLRNFPYWTMHMTRPDMTLERIGEVAGPYLTSEYAINFDLGAGLGSLCGLAAIYDDPVARGWARQLNGEFAAGPDGFEPSAYPFFDPDTTARPTAPRSTLPTTHDFDGWGVICARSGWGEDDTLVTFKYGDNFWSHTQADTGSFTIMHRGSLAIHSGNYRPGSASPHEVEYGKQSIAHNTLLIVDPADAYPTQTFTTIDETGSVLREIPNDGGQRRVGSGMNQRFFDQRSPITKADWMANYDTYHMGSLVAYHASAAYTYAAVDMTPAYGNAASATSPNATCRTKRADLVVRHLLFVPPRYVVVYDQVRSTDPAFTKKWLLHSVNQPLVTGNRFEIRRTELVDEAPYNWTLGMVDVLRHASADGLKYQYGGKLVGWMVEPQGAISVVGGKGREFWIEDPQRPGTGTNWNQSMPGQCEGAWSFLTPDEPNRVSSDARYAPVEPGSWRIEESPASPARDDRFLNVMLAADAGDSDVPARVDRISDATRIGAQWSDGTGSYRVAFARDGLGGHLTVSGVQAIDEDLATALPPATDGGGTTSG